MCETIHFACPCERSIGGSVGAHCICAHSVSKKSFRHAVRIFKLSKKFKNTCRLNAKGAFCPLHTSPAALSQTSSARFFDSLGAHCICAHAQPPQPPEPGSQRARVRADIQSAPTGAVGGLPRPQRPAGRCGHRPLRRRGPLNCRATSAAHPRWVRRGRDSVSFWLRQNRGSNPIPSIKNQHARKGRVGFLAERKGFEPLRRY